VESITYKLSKKNINTNAFFHNLLFSNNFVKTATQPIAENTDEKFGLPKNPNVPELLLDHGNGSKLKCCNKLYALFMLTATISVFRIEELMLIFS
jgi:hypothetical protein